MTTRSSYLARVASALGRRRLVFFGTRGADARSLSDLPCFEEIVSQVAPSNLSGIRETCLESLTGRRVDLDSYDIDLDHSEAVASLRQRLLDALAEPSAVIPYRSCALLASAWFPRSSRSLHLGNFHDKQSCFEHKPWVETQLAALGILAVPWRYYADDERVVIEERLATGPLVIRSNKSSGGTGVKFVEGPEQLDAHWPEHDDGFLAVAPFVTGVSVNVNGVVYSDGRVSRHGASVQLVGLPECTARRFGYCGNDFGAASRLDDAELDALDTLLVRVGQWLAGQGYRGAFGIDAILRAGRALLVEVNPRFQGSSRLSAMQDVEDDRADMFLAHIAAWLGLGAPDDATLRDLASTRPPRAHVVMHARALEDRGHLLAGTRGLELVPAEGVQVEPGAILWDAVFEQLVTTDGTSLESTVVLPSLRKAEGVEGDD